MDGFAKVEFVDAYASVETLAELVTEFAHEASDWRFLHAESAEYARAVSHPALIIERVAPEEWERVHVAITEMQSKPGRLCLCNILPVQGELSCKQYNTYAKRFVIGFRRFARRHGLSARATLSIPRRPQALPRIIRGERTRALFERFLAPGLAWGTPTITHPNDIERLDAFICALHRWRSRIDLAALHTWLIEFKRWPKQAADWTCHRIDTGLEVLSVDRRF